MTKENIEQSLRLIQAGAARGFVSPKDSARALSGLLREICEATGLIDPIPEPVVEVAKPKPKAKPKAKPKTKSTKNVNAGSADEPESITVESDKFRSPKIG